MDYKKIFEESKLKEAKPKFNDVKTRWNDKPEDADQYDDWEHHDARTYTGGCGGSWTDPAHWTSKKKTQAEVDKNSQLEKEWHKSIDNALTKLDKNDEDYAGFLDDNKIEVDEDGNVINIDRSSYYGTPDDIDDNIEDYFKRYKSWATNERAKQAAKNAAQELGSSYLNEYFGVDNGADVLESILNIQQYKNFISQIQSKIEEAKQKTGVTDEMVSSFNEEDLVKYLKENNLLGPKAKRCTTVLKTIKGYFPSRTMELH